MALITCPECNQQISSRARSCPACGYPLASALDKQVTSVKKKAGILMTVVALPYTIHAALGSMSPVWLEWLVRGSVADSFWQIAILTAPLIVAVMLIAYALLEGWIENGAFTTLVSAMLLGVAAYIAFLLADSPPLLAQDPMLYALTNMAQEDMFLPKGWLAAVGAALYAFFMLYGLWNFISAILIGGFCAWVLNSKIHQQLWDERDA